MPPPSVVACQQEPRSSPREDWVGRIPKRASSLPLGPEPELGSPNDLLRDANAARQQLRQLEQTRASSDFGYNTRGDLIPVAHSVIRTARRRSRGRRAAAGDGMFGADPARLAALDRDREAVAHNMAALYAAMPAPGHAPGRNYHRARFDADRALRVPQGPRERAAASQVALFF